MVIKKRTIKYCLIIGLVIVFINFEEENIFQENITLIEMRNKFSINFQDQKHIDNHFIVFHTNKKRIIQNITSIYYIEHNSIYDDILFIIPLYSIIIKSKIIVICNDSIDYYKIYDFSKIIKNKNYTTYHSCIYIDITFLKLLHLHSNIFRFTKYDTVYNTLENRRVNINYHKICKDYNYSNDYSVVTTVYKRKNLNKQIYLFRNQVLPPKHIIIVHDRNIVNISYPKNKIMYYHTINFNAGFYFRYLISLLSPENDVVIYDDDWFPMNNYSQFNWISRIKSNINGLYCHHNGQKNGIRWCATPLLVHRNWLYLMWFNRIYYEKAAEDGHLSFSLLLLCKIECVKETINGLEYKNDNLSSSKKYIYNKLWNDYTLYIKNMINTSYIIHIKQKYHIY